jgi:hypothetical protein
MHTHFLTQRVALYHAAVRLGAAADEAALDGGVAAIRAPRLVSLGGGGGAAARRAHPGALAGPGGAAHACVRSAGGYSARAKKMHSPTVLARKAS